MKKLLIPNGSFHDIPLIKEAKKMGYYVITSGNAPEGKGHPYADRYIPGDFSDKEKMLEIAKENEIDAVCSNCNDFGYLSACYIAEQMGLPGHESYRNACILHHKDEFKAFARKQKLSTPDAEEFASCAKALEWCAAAAYPLIVKPTDLGAGQGIKRIDHFGEAKEAIVDALTKSKSQKIVIEPFIEGTAHSFNAFVINQKVAAYYSDNEYMFYDRYRVSTSASPADGIETCLGTLIHDTEVVAKELKLTDGLVHSQYIRDEKGQAHILEITRRMSGDWYPEPESKATGIDWVHYIFLAQTTVDGCRDFPAGVQQRGYTGRHTLNAPHPGRVKGFEIADALRPYVYDSVIWEKGAYDVINEKKDYPGILFLNFPDRKTQMEAIGNIQNLIKFYYE